MKKIYSLLIVILILAACTNTKKYNKELNEASEVIKERQITNLKEAINIEREGVTSGIFDSIRNTNLLNKRLIGLTIFDEKEKDPYKKFEIDFNSICMSDAPSVYIDTSTENIYVYENSIEEYIRYIFQIDSISIDNNIYSFYTNRIEHTWQDSTYTEYNKTEFIFSKLNSIPIYSFKVNTDNKDSFFYHLRFKFYIPKHVEYKFSRADCGDFDG